MSMLHISAKFFERLQSCKNGKKQTLTAQSQVIRGPYVFKNSAASIRTVARQRVFLRTHIKTRQMLTPCSNYKRVRG